MAPHAAQPARHRFRTEPRLLSVQVWDKSNIGPVEKAIRSAGLGLNPINDGNNLRLPIPDLTEERRKELAKLASKYAEGRGSRAQRAPRWHGSAEGRREQGNLEDERKRAETDVQKLTDEHIKAVDEAAQKEKKSWASERRGR
jgi:ribosome recycling factor